MRFVDKDAIPHIFITEDDVHSSVNSPAPRGYKGAEGWLDMETYVSVNWSTGEIYQDIRPLVVDGTKIGVRAEATASSVELWLEGMPSGESFKVGDYSPEEAEVLLGEQIELYVSPGVGDMYRNGIGRWADHR